MGVALWQSGAGKGDDGTAPLYATTTMIDSLLYVSHHNESKVKTKQNATTAGQTEIEIDTESENLVMDNQPRRFVETLGEEHLGRKTIG